MNLYAFIAGILIAAGIFVGGIHVGRTYEQNTTIKADLKRADLVMVRQVEVIREVPKIVTKVVTREVEVVKEVERVVYQIEDAISPDCVLPDNYGFLLVAAANGTDPKAPGAIDAFAGEYGCREVLKATLADLQAGWRNSARLGGLQKWAALVTREVPQ